MELEEFIKELKKLNKKAKQNKKIYTVKCDIEFIPRIEETFKPKEYCYSTKISGTTIIYTAIVDKEDD